MIRPVAIGVVTLMTATLSAAPADLDKRIDTAAAHLESAVIACRRDIHQHPELGNREFRTSKLVIEKLKALGIEVKTPISSSFPPIRRRTSRTSGA